MEATIGMALGLVTLAAAVQLSTLYRKPSDKREAVRAARAALSLAMEAVVREVREADATLEAAGPTLLLRAPDGRADLFYWRRGAELDSAGIPIPSELVLARDVFVPEPGSVPGATPPPASEQVLATGLSRCSFELAPGLPGGGPPGGGPPAAPGPVPPFAMLLSPGRLEPLAPPNRVVAVLLETVTVGQRVPVSTAASNRNGLWWVVRR